MLLQGKFTDTFQDIWYVFIHRYSTFFPMHFHTVHKYLSVLTVILQARVPIFTFVVNISFGNIDNFKFPITSIPEFLEILETIESVICRNYTCRCKYITISFTSFIGFFAKNVYTWYIFYNGVKVGKGNG